MISTVEARVFSLLFRGKTNSYVKNELPKQRDTSGKKIKTNIVQIKGTVDADLIAKHLNGEFGVGICPVNSEGTCYFGVIDIDSYDTTGLLKVLSYIKDYQIPLVPFRSKSGGLHLYCFLTKAVNAKKLRDLLNKFIYFFCLEHTYGQGKVEIFPKQDKAEGFGSAITLPYFNAEESYNYMLSTDNEPVPFKNVYNIIKTKMTTLEDFEAILDNLPFGDAPVCLQRILLSQSIGAEDSGRNNFLFSYAIYAKKKYGVGFESYVNDINNDFDVPLEEQVVEQIISSVNNNEYIYKCKDIPCNSFCDKTLCKKREFGLGKDKGHFTGVDYGQLFRYNSSEPYYIWKLRLQGQENWKDVIFKDEGFLLDQKNFAKMCVRYLNQAPMQVSNNDWYAILNSVLPHIQEIEVAKETDTSKTAVLSNAFINYLANKQARRDSPCQVRIGLCYRQNEMHNGKMASKYYFSHQGFEDYLRNHKLDFDPSMMRENLKSFGAKEDKLTYVNALGEPREYNCWSKFEDSDISEAYEGNVEVLNSDNITLGIQSISEATNAPETETETKATSYTKEDSDNAEDMF